MSDQVFMDEIPLCDFCKEEKAKIIPERAYVDGRTQFGNLAYMCRRHWDQLGGTQGLLGDGLGQRLVLRPTDDEKETT